MRIENELELEFIDSEVKELEDFKMGLPNDQNADD